METDLEEAPPNTPVTAAQAAQEQQEAQLGAALETLFVSNATLTDVDLGGNCLGWRVGGAVAAGLRRNAVITRLDLAGNALRGNGGEALGVRGGWVSGG